MDVSTQTAVPKRNFSQQTGESGDWDIEQKNVGAVVTRERYARGERVEVIPIINLELSNKGNQNQGTQTGEYLKNKAVQTLWHLYEIELEEKHRSNRKSVIELIVRNQFFKRIEEEFSVPSILSPIREEREHNIAEDPEDWKTWKAGQFFWQTKKEDIKKQPIRETSSDKKREKNDEKDTVQIMDIEKKKEANNKENQSANIEKKRKENDGDDKPKVKKMKREDLETLQEKKWLNDEIINSYLDLLSEDETLGHRIYGMNSFFFPRLHISGYQAIKRWTKKINLFEFDKVIVPIHLGHHWCLAVINFGNKTIKYYDSLGGENRQYLEELLQYLMLEASKKGQRDFNKEEWKLVIKKNIPRQLNTYDCGVFICMFARYEAEGKRVDFDQRDMSQLRRKIKKELEAGSLEK
ncbi:sentrin-specific protease 1-like [Venturia canescens]|uniref:sentrin-specific protease 1-like n=1 Tax=Venturia canescens TaxID=32260 RepID=UPI001C9C2003|nr:sentrin-specific protease 1-like [Venturia canescens]